MRTFLKITGIQLACLASALLLFWGGLKLYGSIDREIFPNYFALPDKAATLLDKEKGKLLLDSITNQIEYELDSFFGFSYNDIVTNRFLFDNRAYRQYGVYHATKFLLDLYASDIAKLGNSDRENENLHKARISQFTIDPANYMFPSAEDSYYDGLELLDDYKKELDSGKATFNCRTDDLYAAFQLVTGENLLGYALGLLQNAQELSFYELDNRIYEAQGIVLVVRDFVNTLYTLYPEIKQKNNEDNMNAAKMYLDRICTYNPLYISSSYNSGELVISYLLFAQERLTDILKSLRI